MRSALALWALLLLLPPRPSRSQDDAGQLRMSTTTSANPSNTPIATASRTSSKPYSSVMPNATAAAISTITTQKIALTTSDAVLVQGSSSPVSKAPSEAPHSTQPSPSVVPTSHSNDKTTLETHIITTASGTGRPHSSLPTSASPVTTDHQNNIKKPTVTGDHGSTMVTTDSMTPQGGNLTISPSPQVVSTPNSTLAPVLSSPGKPDHSPGVTSKTPESSSKGQHSPTMNSSSASSESGPGLTTTAQRMSTPQSPVGPTLGTQQTSGQMPISVTPTLMPTSLSPSSLMTPKPMSSSPGIMVTPAVSGGPSFSLRPAPAAPQSPSTGPQTSYVKNIMVHCEPLEKLKEDLLVLNLTGVSPENNSCDNISMGEKLVTVLCQAALPAFKSDQDNCTIWLALVPKSQTVVIKHITIQKNSLPKDIFTSLKNHWDEVKEMGVSDMMLGKQGLPEDEDRFSMPLIITIVCMASFLLLVAALYGCCHQRFSQRKDQQRLTEELQTVENGYHDNPTLEVMETSSEMQEKKVVNLNGELGDSWIVPLDNLTKDDLDEEEDTHL